MINIKKMGFGFWTGVKVLSVVSLVGSTGAVLAIENHTPNVCLTQTCENRYLVPGGDAVSAADSVPDRKNSVVSINTKTVEGKAPADPADVRAMIVDEYGKYMSGMKSYVATTYPTLASLNATLKAWRADPKNNPAALMQYRSQIGLESVDSQVESDIRPQIASEILSFCDLNHSISTEDERSYCHSVFQEAPMYQEATK